MEDKVNRMKVCIIGLEKCGTLDQATGILKLIESLDTPVCVEFAPIRNQNDLWESYAEHSFSVSGECEIKFTESEYKNLGESYLKYLSSIRINKSDKLSKIEQENKEFRIQIHSIEKHSEKLELILDKVAQIHRENLFSINDEQKLECLIRLNNILSPISSLLHSPFLLYSRNELETSFYHAKNIYHIVNSITSGISGTLFENKLCEIAIRVNSLESLLKYLKWEREISGEFTLGLSVMEYTINRNGIEHRKELLKKYL